MARWNQHVYSAERKAGKGCAHFWAAIRKYGKDAFSHEVLEVCETLEEANAAEERWIEALGTLDPAKGFNLMRGGKHVPHPVKNPWDRPEYREKQMPRLLAFSKDPLVRAASIASMRTPESRARRSLSSRLSSTQAVREKISQKSKLSNSDPNVRKKNSESHLGKKLSPEHRAKVGLAFKGRKHSVDSRAKMSAALKGKIFTPEHRASISKGQRGRILSNETREKIGAAHRGKKHDEERCRKQSEAQMGRTLPPEVYVRIAAACKATREKKRGLR